jgi:hypothetical protein
MRLFTPLRILLLVIVFHLPYHGAFGQIAFAIHDQPQLYYELEWNHLQSAWDSAFRFICNYDINGRRTDWERQFYHFNDYWVNSQRTEIRYVAQPDSMIYTQFTWNGSGWSNAFRIIHVKDSQGRITHELYYTGSFSWNLDHGQRLSYFNNGSGQIEDVLIEDYDAQAGAWDTTQVTHFVYGAGSSAADTVLYDNYLNGTWVPSYRDVAIQWFDFSQFKASQYTRQIWTNNQYLNEDKAVCAHGPFGYRRCTTDRWVNNQWQPYSREKNLQDAAGHPTETGLELYNGSTWEIDEWRIFDHTYNGGHLTETLYRFWDFQTQQISTNQQYKYVFFDHAVEVAPPAEGRPLIAFPQPARDRLYVRCDLRGALRLRLHDLQGRLLLDEGSDAVRLVESGIDISLVPNGLYLLQVEAAQSVHTVRIHVQH